MVSSVQVQEPVSRTDQYKRVMKPLLERKRRARINRCLDELRDLLVAALQAEGETVTRLEKADILELTVRHVRRLNQRRRLTLPGPHTQAQDMRQDAIKFQQGFVAAAQQVQNFLVSTSALEPTTSSRLLSHLTSCASSMLGPQTPPPPAPPVVVAPSSSHVQIPTSSSQMHYSQRSNPPLHIPQVISPKSSPPLSPPPLIDLRVKPEPYVPSSGANNVQPIQPAVIVPTPLREPAVAGPQDLSMRRQVSREVGKEHAEERISVRPHPYSHESRNHQNYPRRNNERSAADPPKDTTDAWRPW